ncbi:MAG: GTP cyclohydrolase II [Alphaproteobacteria bacterium]|jgi:GTP cyclohydrolase II|nr:GTP cyclohydrolase II [Alphaproteobacteria bacterium]MDP6253596.1 GTP cyclohydrolase II [Alphaproteobacteria bacterium]MDP7055866.1 GTP cyclohydrolase II [Alphaproteobacteria bacterium]MDP7228981.1 GTP cyclohydrolase II [Alphaproteobacteria bacterium]MDP7461177.1 GTP cyclohydrolase II [Alphaproteobacteria bacterium]|tara:strand:+ start:5379 stop:6512 length:1134 start_codon:yes stop_codon:yes gene_type:complete
MTKINANIITVDRAIAEYRRGRPVLLESDDGDNALALAAEQASPDSLRGLCEWYSGRDGGQDSETHGPVLALTESRASALHIKPTGHGVILLPVDGDTDVGIVQTLADGSTDLAQPMRGPFQRLRRAPRPTESAAVQLAKAARLLPSAVIVPLPDETDISSAETRYLSVRTRQIAEYEQSAAATLRKVAEAPVPLTDAENCRLIAFRPADGGVEHLAIVVGDPDRHHPVLTRLHSECFTGDLLASLKCDCGEQLRGAIALMAEQGDGVLLYLAQEGRGIGLMNKLRAYSLQAEGFDTVEANLRLGFDADERVFRPAAEMLRLLGFSQVRLLTNNPDKVAGLEACGITVSERVTHAFPANLHNDFYLRTKKDRSGHLL